MYYTKRDNTHAAFTPAPIAIKPKPNTQLVRGFTFVEIIIVMVMVSVVSLAIYSTFNNGLKIWQRVNRQLPAEDLNIIFDKFRSDVKNTFLFTGAPFLGTQSSLELPTIVNSRNLEAETVGKVIYIYDSGKNEVLRQVRDFSKIFNGEEGVVTFRLSNIGYLGFEYYFYDKEKNLFTWKDEWIGEAGLPLAIRMILELKDTHQQNRFIRTVSIPVSGQPN